MPSKSFIRSKDHVLEKTRKTSLRIDLLLLAVSDRKRVGFSLILLCKNRFGFQSEVAKSKKSIEMKAVEQNRYSFSHFPGFCCCLGLQTEAEDF